MNSKLVVLCVDDDLPVLESLQIELKRLLRDECIIETAEASEDALELVTELQEEGYEVALVLSDYIMPNIKGDKLLQRIHNLSPRTLKIMLSAQANLKAVGNAIKYARLCRYIAKPWQAEDLKITVVEALHSYLQDKKIAERNLRLRKLNQAYERFVPQQFLEILNKESIIDVQLGDHKQQEMSILFADIRDFIQAAKLFSECLPNNYKDRAAQNYLERCQNQVDRGY